MADFFEEKIRLIHDGLAKLKDDSIPLDPDPMFAPHKQCLTDFSPVTEEDVEKVIKQAAPKSCCLDPAPTQLIKECLDVLVPVITRIINQSFENGYVPKSLKLAAVTPLLKKVDLIAEILKNFRPISNLPFLSKVLEKCAAKQMIQHKEENNLREKLQSAYREHHCTETALLKINHDLLMALDRKECVMMAMLDLSAAFDTVNHETLLNRLFTRYGIRGMAHNWLKSYLTDRRQFVTIAGERSQEHKKDCDVPQGSILGPNLYEDYTGPPVGDIFRKHNLLFHIYADDKQAYLPFHIHEEKAAMKKLIDCLMEVRQWMTSNSLKFNDSKTEFIMFGPKKDTEQLCSTSLTLGDTDVPISTCVKSIGAHLDSELKMDTQISAVCRAAWFYLHQISKIRRYLNDDQLKTVIQAHVISRIDQNNSLLIGLPIKDITRIQRVQNASARLIGGIRKHDHITPVMKSLHWLPVEQRILFKTLVLTFKSLNGKGPAYLQELLQPYRPTRSLRSEAANLLIVPKTRYVKTQKRAFGIRAPLEWNKLPDELKHKSSVESFKRALKTHLFRIAYG